MARTPKTEVGDQGSVAVVAPIARIFARWRRTQIRIDAGGSLHRCVDEDSKLPKQLHLTRRQTHYCRISPANRGRARQKRWRMPTATAVWFPVDEGERPLIEATLGSAPSSPEAC
jgi:hypothetical protein